MPQLGVRIPAASLWRFWSMVAHYHGQIWNGAELARALGISEHAVRSHKVMQIALDAQSSPALARLFSPYPVPAHWSDDG
jgi:hypothetical protein